MSRRLARAILLLPVLAYTAFSAGPYLWTAMMSLRTTEEIYRRHYGLTPPAPLLLPVPPYTASSAGPYIWRAMMSLRTPEEIYRSHYGLPIPAHWLKYATAWNEFGYATYFKNSTIVAVISVLIVSVIGSMSGYAFARRRFQFPL